MFTVDSVTFDLTGCTLTEQAPRMKAWMSPHHVADRINLYPIASENPLSWSFDLTDIDAATEFYQRQCAANGGVMLSVDKTSAGGVEAMRGIFKYRAPIPGSLAMYIVGILYLPFQQCTFQINVEAMEEGKTGIREAAVMVIEQANLPAERLAEAPEPVMLKEGEGMFDRLAAMPLRKLSADEERWDGSFPDHPLSKVRARLAKIADTIQIDPEVRAFGPFRVAKPQKGWKIWGR